MPDVQATVDRADDAKRELDKAENDVQQITDMINDNTDKRKALADDYSVVDKFLRQHSGPATNGGKLTVKTLPMAEKHDAIDRERAACSTVAEFRDVRGDTTAVGHTLETLEAFETDFEQRYRGEADGNLRRMFQALNTNWLRGRLGYDFDENVRASSSQSTKKFLEQDEGQGVIQRVDQQLGGNNQRRVELWVQNMLAQKSGPKRALEILYDRGSAHEFLKLLESVEGQADDARDFITLRDEKIRALEALDNRNERYYAGNLRTKDGSITKHLGAVSLTAVGKMQLFLNGNGALEIALRNEVGKRWIARLVEMEKEEKRVRDLYNEDLEEERKRGKAEKDFQLEHLKSQGVGEQSARGMLRGSKRNVYQALLNPVGIKSGVDGFLVARGKLRVDDAQKCGVERENDTSIGKEEVRRLRQTVKGFGNEGTRILHSREADLSFQATRLMMNDPNMKPNEAYKIVKQQCIDNKMFVLRDRDGEIESAEEHCRVYFDKRHDKEIKRVELAVQAAEAEAAAAGAAAAGSSGGVMAVEGGGGGGGASGSGGESDASSNTSGDGVDAGGGRRLRMGSGPPTYSADDAFDDFDDAASDTSSASVDLSKGSPSLLRTKKKPRQRDPAYHVHSAGASRADGLALAFGGSARASSLALPGAAAHTMSHKEDEGWTPYLEVVDGRGINFENIAKYLRSSEGVAWKQSNNIAHFATAKELLEW